MLWACISLGLYFVGLLVTDLYADRYTFMFTCSLRISGPHFIILNVTDLLFIDLHVKLCVLYDRVSCLCLLTFWHRSFTFNSNKSPT